MPPTTATFDKGAGELKVDIHPDGSEMGDGVILHVVGSETFLIPENNDLGPVEIHRYARDAINAVRKRQQSHKR